MLGLDLPGAHIQGRKQRGRTMALVLMVKALEARPLERRKYPWARSSA